MLLNLAWNFKFVYALLGKGFIHYYQRKLKKVVSEICRIIPWPNNYTQQKYCILTCNTSAIFNLYKAKCLFAIEVSCVIRLSQITLSSFQPGSKWSLCKFYGFHHLYERCMIQSPRSCISTLMVNTHNTGGDIQIKIFTNPDPK